MDQMVDRISILPDDLLCHILSFLPIRQAFQTSVLSKRWTPLCYSLSVLCVDFDYEIEDEAFVRFCRFVDTIMLSPRALSQPLKTFRLKCISRTPIQNMWLEAAKCRRVEEFHLIMNFHTLYPGLFISRTLVVLKLDMIEITCNTSCVHLPSVKTLDLKFVYFKTHKDYVNFLSACPILQDLHAKHIYVRSEMNHDKNNVVPENGFKYSVTLSKLVRASINSKDVLFNGIDDVKFLRIITGFRSQEASFKFIPLFSNLIHIDLLFFNSSFHCWDGVVELLRHSPKLQILFIKKWTSTGSTEEWKCPISVLECVSSHLRSCTILDFQGLANDLRFATYILQNARHLQDMKINICSNVMPSEKSMIVEELSSCPRRCKLSFEHKYCY